MGRSSKLPSISTWFPVCEEARGMHFIFAGKLDQIAADRVNSTMDALLNDKFVLKGRTILLVSSQDGSKFASAAHVGTLQCIKPLCACAASRERGECWSISGISPSHVSLYSSRGQCCFLGQALIIKQSTLSGICEPNTCFPSRWIC